MSTRNARYKDILSTELLASPTAVVIGVGAVGRQVALQLATIGFRNLVLVDPDKVAVENLGCQGYRSSQINSYKVDATLRDCIYANCSTLIVSHARRFIPEFLVPNAHYFLCVDTITSRALIHKMLNDTPPHGRAPAYASMYDARMAGDTIRIIIDDPKTESTYEDTLFPEAEAEPGRCTSRSTLYGATLAASFLVAEFVRALQGKPAPVTDYTLSLNSMELFETPMAQLV